MSLSLIKDVYARRELLWILVSRNLKIRYKSSALGFLWSLLTPLCLILIYATFAKILRFAAGDPDYLPFLVTGIVVWQFLSMCLNDALHAIVGNVSLVKKTPFPRIVLPLSTVIANLVNFLLTAVVLVGYLAIKEVSFGNPVLLPLILLTQAALCLGMALVLSTGNVFFRDAEHILGVATLAWFFLTPIFYPFTKQLAFMPESWQWLIFLNPMTGIVCAYRTALMSLPGPGIPMTAISFGVSWIVLLMGIIIFQSCQEKFADEL